MTSYRIETVSDESSSHVLVEIHRERDGALVARSGPVFASHDEAEERLLEAIGKAWPSQPVDPVYPANGS